jgi:hypothetical protein
MTADDLREMLRVTPFRPFDIHLADGRSLPVEHPEFVAFTPRGCTIGVGLPTNVFAIVDLLLVTSLEPRPNGGRRNPRRKKPPE